MPILPYDGHTPHFTGTLTTPEKTPLELLDTRLAIVSTWLDYAQTFRSHAQTIGNQASTNGATLIRVATQLDELAGTLAEKAVFDYRKASE